MRLIIEDLEGATTVVNLGSEDVTIGRTPHNTIQLTEQNVSRSHAKLAVQDDGWLVEDLGSYNGVRVNGMHIQGPTLLQANDLIQIGDYQLTLADDADRATVDIGPRAAANDYTPAASAMSSSAELPSVSVEDLQPARAGASASMPAGASASSSSGAAPRPASGEGESRSKAGLIVGILGVGLAAGAVALWLFGGKTGDEGTKVADAGPAQAQATGEAPPEQEEPAAAAGPTAEPTGEPTGDPAPGAAALAAETGAAAGTESAETGAVADTEAAGEDAGELVEDPGAEPIVDEPAVADPAPAPASKPKPKPRDKPAEPKLPPDEALAAARKASLTGNNKQAYSLAKDAYDQNKSSEALSVMGVAACKMGSASKAKSAYNKMSNAKDKQTLEKICEPLGISFD